MKNRKWSVLILSLSLLITTISGSAAAMSIGGSASVGGAVATAEDQQQVLERIIPQVRQKIDVPASMDKFDANYWSNGNSMNYELRWTNSQNDYEYISATANEFGELQNVYMESSGVYNDYQPRFPQLSKEEAAVKALQLLKRLMPERIEQLDTENAEVSYSRYSGYSVNYKRILNGITFLEDNVSISLHPNSGTLRSMYANWQGREYLKTDSAEKIISTTDAWQALCEKIGLKLHYSMQNDRYYGSNSVAPTVILEYTWNDSPSYYIDALNGEIYQRPSYYDKLYSGGAGRSSPMMMNMDSMTEEETLTPKEQEHVDKLEGLLSGEAALAKLLAMPYLQLDGDLNLQSFERSTSYDGMNRELIWLGLKGQTEKGESRWADAQLDAKTGELIYFSGYRDYSYKMPTSAKIDEADLAAAERIAENFIKAVKPQFATQIERGQQYFEKYRYGNFVTVRFTRRVNNLPFEQNYLNIEVDCSTGKIVGYNQNWNESLVFPENANLIGLDRAYEILAALQQPTLQYLSVLHFEDDAETTLLPTDYDAKLIYQIANLYGLSIEAKTGEVRQYGTLYRPESSGDIIYSDLSEEHDAKKIAAVMSMLRRPSEEMFRPDEQITQIELLRWLQMLFSDYDYSGSDDDFYRMLVTNGVWDEDMRDPDRKLTAYEGAEYMMRFLNLKPYTLLKGVFVNPLQLSETEAAYVALAAGSKAIDLETFVPDTALTRYEAAMQIYNYLAR